MRPSGSARGIGEDEGWAQVGVFVEDGPEGEKRRALVAEAVAENANDYSQLNVEAGYHYPAGAMVPDQTPLHPDASSPIHYRPTTRPGHHLPHVWVRRVDGVVREEPVSTLDLVGQGGFTLFVDPAAANTWFEAAQAATDDGGMSVTVVVVDDAEQEWVRVRQVDTGGAVLVRPDRKVCWRATDTPTDPATALREAVHVVLGGGQAATDDPAEPDLERIRRAASRLAQ